MVEQAADIPNALSQLLQLKENQSGDTVLHKIIVNGGESVEMLDVLLPTSNRKTKIKSGWANDRMKDGRQVIDIENNGEVEMNEFVLSLFRCHADPQGVDMVRMTKNQALPVMVVVVWALRV